MTAETTRVSRLDPIIGELADARRSKAFYDAEVEAKIAPLKAQIAAIEDEYNEIRTNIADRIEYLRDEIASEMHVEGSERVRKHGLVCWVSKRKKTALSDLYALRLYLESAGVSDEYTTINVEKVKRELGTDLPGFTTTKEPVFNVKDDDTTDG